MCSSDLIGARASLALTGPLLVAATGCAAFGPPGVPVLLGWLAFAVSVVVAVLGPAVLWRRPAGKLAFYAIFVVVALELAVIVADGHRLR